MDERRSRRCHNQPANERDDHSGGEGHGDCDGDRKCLDAAIVGFRDDNYDKAAVIMLTLGGRFFMMMAATR